MSTNPIYHIVEADEDSLADTDSECKDTMSLEPVDEGQELSDETKTDTQPYVSVRRFNATNSFITKLKNDKKIELKTTDLDEEEIDLLTSQINSILSKTPFQKQVFNKIISKNPSVSKAISNSTENKSEEHCEMLFKMLTLSYNYVINKLHKPLHAALTTHTKYDCSEEVFVCILDTLLETILNHKSIKWSQKRYEKTNLCWNKVHKTLKDMIHKIYAKRLKRYLMKIRRTLPDNDIESVVSVWNQYIVKQQTEVARFLCNKFSKETKIIRLYKKYNINVTAEKGIIQLIQMWDATINMVQNKEEIIPHLKALGLLHGKMGIKPKDLAIMKYILIDLVKAVMGFDYNENIKDSWNKVLTFYIGTMIQSLKERTNSMSLISMTDDTSNMALAMDGFGEKYDVNDIDDIQKHLTSDVITNCQSSWKCIVARIDKTTKLFYDELVNTSIYSNELSDLFVNSNDKNKLKHRKTMFCSIGSTAMLLDDIDKLIQILEELGRRHLYYNVKPEFFTYIKMVFFKCLKKALTIKWNKRLKYSWNVLWDFCVYFMKSSLEDALLLYIPPEPVSVKFKVLINHIDRVKVSDLSFYADIWLAAYTGNNASQSHAFGDNKTNGTNDTPKNKSLPFGGIKCLNAMQITDRYRSLREPYIRYFEDNESWYLRSNIVGTFSQTFDLRSYPFDKHDIELLFALERDDTISSFDTEHITVRMMPFKLDAMAGCNYNVYEPTIELIKHSASKGGSSSGKKYTHCRIVIPISRIYKHSLYNIMLPLTIVELAAFSIYFTDLFPITARLILSMTLLLTLVAFRRSISSSLPPTPYLTVIDHIFNSACLLSLLHIIGLCFINQFQYLSMDKCEMINWFIAFFAFIVFLIVHVVLIWKAQYYISLYPEHTVQEMLDTNDAMGMIARKIDKQMTRKSVLR